MVRGPSRPRRSGSRSPSGLARPGLIRSLNSSIEPPRSHPPSLDPAQLRVSHARQDPVEADRPHGLSLGEVDRGGLFSGPREEPLAMLLAAEPIILELPDVSIGPRRGHFVQPMLAAS